MRNHFLAVEHPSQVGKFLLYRLSALHVVPVLLCDQQSDIHILRVERVLTPQPGGDREDVRVDQRERQSHEFLAGAPGNIGQAGHLPQAETAQGVIERVEALEALEWNNDTLAD